MSQFVWTFPGGKLKQEVTEIVLVNATALTEDILVPTGKIWILLSIRVVNMDDVTRAFTATKYKEAAKTNAIRRLMSVSLATGTLGQWPGAESSATIGQGRPTAPGEILVAGNILSCVWASGGASAGSTDVDGLVIQYLEIDAP